MHQSDKWHEMLCFPNGFDTYVPSLVAVEIKCSPPQCSDRVEQPSFFTYQDRCRRSMPLILLEFWINTLRPRENGSHFADDIFKCIFLNENVWISIKIALNFIPKIPINNIPALFQIMAWRCQGDKSLSEPMMVSLLTHICVTRPQWVNKLVLCSSRCE